MSSVSPRRQRRSQEEWRALVAEWEGSGVSADRFAAAHDVGRVSLYGWARRFREEGSTPRVPGRSAAFSEVEVVAGHMAAAERSLASISIVTKGGYEVRVVGPVDRESLARVLEVVSRC